jgi:hypothetical protein
MKVKKPVVKCSKGYWDIYINGENVVSIDYDTGTILLFIPYGTDLEVNDWIAFRTFIFKGTVKPSPVSSHSSKRGKKEGKDG